MPCSLVQLARVVIVRVILVDVVCVMLVVLIAHVDVVHAVDTVFVAIFVVIFCNWRMYSLQFSQLARRQQRTLHVKHVESDLETNLCPVHVSRPTLHNSGTVMLELDRVCS